MYILTCKNSLVKEYLHVKVWYSFWHYIEHPIPWLPKIWYICPSACTISIKSSKLSWVEGIISKLDRYLQNNWNHLAPICLCRRNMISLHAFWRVVNSVGQSALLPQYLQAFLYFISLWHSIFFQSILIFQVGQFKCSGSYISRPAFSYSQEHKRVITVKL